MLPMCIAILAFQGLPPSEAQPDWVRRQQTAKIAGRTVRYQTTAGRMPIRSAAGAIQGRMFFTYYKRTDLPAGTERPVTFVFNGGPGSASYWLHLGFVGPKRPQLGSPEGFLPPPPYRLIPNDDSLLPETDLVTIDPIGAGYSRVTAPSDLTRFNSADGDIESFGEFILSFLSTEKRWHSPVFVLGESYGGIRGSGLLYWLNQAGVGVNGLILISPVIGPLYSGQDRMRDHFVASAFGLPSVAAAAWYHRRLGPELQAMPLAKVYEAALKFTREEYVDALPQADKLSPERQASLLAGLTKFTGLSEAVLRKFKFNVRGMLPLREIVRADRDVLGLYDARFTAIDPEPTENNVAHEVAMNQMRPPFATTINQYLSDEIGYKTALRYRLSAPGVGGWSGPDGGALDMTGYLLQSLVNNPYTKVMLAMGYYDQVCTMASNDEVLDRMQLEVRLQPNIIRARYPSGHMLYIDDAVRRQLHHDVASFIRSQSRPKTSPGTFRKR